MPTAQKFNLVFTEAGKSAKHCDSNGYSVNDTKEVTQSQNYSGN